MKEPDQPRLWIDRGRRLGSLGRWDEAKQAFDRASKLAPGSPRVSIKRGRACEDLKQWDEAASAFVAALEKTPEPKDVFPYFPWSKGPGEVDALIARSDEVAPRVARLRPADRIVSARRAEFLAESGRWAEAQAALRVHIERFPDGWWAPNPLAKSLLLEGKAAEFKDVCRRAIDHIAERTDYYASINLVRTALLAPAGFEREPTVKALIASADKQEKPEFWLQVGAALAEYRQGAAAAALQRLDSRATPYPGYDNTQALLEVLRALACKASGELAKARAALGRARRPWPDTNDGRKPNPARLTTGITGPRWRSSSAKPRHRFQAPRSSTPPNHWPESRRPARNDRPALIMRRRGRPWPSSLWTLAREMRPLPSSRPWCANRARSRPRSLPTSISSSSSPHPACVSASS